MQPTHASRRILLPVRNWFIVLTLFLALLLNLIPFGRLPGIAVCESGAQDSLNDAEWSFVAAGGSRQITDRLLSGIEDFVAETVDARVTARDLEQL